MDLTGNIWTTIFAFEVIALDIAVTVLCWMIFCSYSTQVKSCFSRRIRSRLTGPRATDHTAGCSWICAADQLKNP